MYEKHFRYRPFHTHIWSKEEQLEAYQGFINFKNYGDYASYVDQGHPNRWLIGEMQSFYPIKYSELDLPWKKDNFKFAKVAEVRSIDINGVLNQIESETEHLNTQETDYHCPGERPSFTKEMSFLEKHNLGRSTHITDITANNYPELNNLAHSLELENIRCIIRTHLPGVVLASHCDKSASLFENYHEDVSGLPLNHITKTPEGYYVVFILIALNDWESGHMFAFEDEMWSWKAGDVLTFDWPNIRHATANAGWSRRHLVRICGITKDPNHWAFNNANKGYTSYI